MSQNEITLRITADASGVEDGANHAREQIEKATQSVSALADMLGVKVPESIQTLIASSALLGPALEEVLPVVAVGTLITEMYQLNEEHKQITAAIYGESAAWRALRLDATNFADDTRIRLLEIRERIDAITAGPLTVLKDRLQRIDAVSFEQLKQQFKSIADEANKGFAGMQESRLMALVLGDSDVQESIKAVADNFQLIMDRINSAEKHHDVAAIGRVLDEEILKTRQTIKTDSMGGLPGTKQLIAANERLLQVLTDLKNAYSSVQQVAAGDKQLEKLESVGQAERRVQVITVQAQRDRIDTTRLAGQQVVADYQQSFATINASTQQFNSQQLSILMTGINNNSNRILQATDALHKKLQAKEAEAQQQRAKLWDQTFKGISGAFSTFINGIVSGHQTLSQAWVKMVDGMAAKFIDGLEKQLMSFAEHKLMELTIHTSTEAAKDQASQAAHAKEDERTAYSAAKAAWESVVHTPIIGPLIAPIAAASTFAAVSAFGSAEGGQYLVPAEQLTMLHRNEMVLPAGVADRMRGVIEGGGGGGVTVVVNHSVSAVDAESFQAHLRRHANLIGQEVSRMLKKRTMASV